MVEKLVISKKARNRMKKFKEKKEKVVDVVEVKVEPKIPKKVEMIKEKDIQEEVWEWLGIKW